MNIRTKITWLCPMCNHQNHIELPFSVETNSIFYQCDECKSGYRHAHLMVSPDFGYTHELLGDESLYTVYYDRGQYWYADEAYNEIGPWFYESHAKAKCKEHLAESTLAWAQDMGVACVVPKEEPRV